MKLKISPKKQKQTILHVRMLELMQLFDQSGHSKDIHRTFDVVNQHDQTVFAVYFFQACEVGMIVAPLPLYGAKNVLVNLLPPSV